MRTGDALFLALVAVWIFGRFLMRRWLREQLAAGRITKKQAFVVHAGSFAIIPLLAVPFVSSGWIVLIALSIFVFLFEVAIVLFAFRFIQGPKL